VDGFRAEGAAPAAALLCRMGAVTRGCVGRVKGRCTKQRQEVPRVKMVWPYEDALGACKRRGVTVIPLSSV
jgi:hypothetical protein